MNQLHVKCADRMMNITSFRSAERFVPNLCPTGASLGGLAAKRGLDMYSTGISGT